MNKSSTTTIEWKGKMEFEATPPSGNKWTMDAYVEVGGQNLGPTPLEAFVGAAATCSAMDVIYILKLKKQVVISYRLEVDGDRDEARPYPRPYQTLKIRHILEGEIDEAVLDAVVRDSDQRLCTALATLRSGPEITSEWMLERSVTPLG